MSEPLSDSERKLIEKLRRIEALFAGAKTEGERDAAARAKDRIQEALDRIKQSEPAIEQKFFLADEWRRRLFVSLLRRYGIRPYRYRGQRYTTVMARVPRSFVEKTLWPEFCELADSLVKFLGEVTDRVIAEAMGTTTQEAEEREPGQLP